MRKYCSFCGCNLPDDYESDICMCCQDELLASDPGDEEDSQC